MEIGQKVYWIVDDKKYEGLFIELNSNNLAEIICYSMNGVSCKLRVFVELDKVKTF